MQVDPKAPVSPEDLPQDATLGYAAAAALLGVEKGTLYAWTSQRRVPHFRIGPRCVRFDRSALLAWLKSHAVPAVCNSNRGEVAP